MSLQRGRLYLCLGKRFPLVYGVAFFSFTRRVFLQLEGVEILGTCSIGISTTSEISSIQMVEPETVLKLLNKKCEQRNHEFRNAWELQYTFQLSPLCRMFCKRDKWKRKGDWLRGKQRKEFVPPTGAGFGLGVLPVGQKHTNTLNDI